MNTLSVPIAKPYHIHFGDKLLLATLKELLGKTPHHKIVILTDTTVACLYRQTLAELISVIPEAPAGSYPGSSRRSRLCASDAGLAGMTGVAFCVNPILITIAAGEEFKTRETKAEIEDQMLAVGCNRDTLLIAIGGGVITDIGGFVAATFCRGIDVIYCPTTLLAMVDASIGGKTAVNTPCGKNLIGAFYQPKAVVVDISFIKTQSESDYIAGLGEIVKHALLMDEELLVMLEEQLPQILNRDLSLLSVVIQRSCELKARVVANDETEQGLRAILNFGHTFAHALECSANYQLAHGLAVLLGCYFELTCAATAGICDEALVARLQRLLGRLPIAWGDLLAGHTIDALIALMGRDKKCLGGAIRFVRLPHIGAYAELMPGEQLTGSKTAPQSLLVSYEPELIKQVHQAMAFNTLI